MQTGILKDEILRRRTFAIISHPDAGKTTLTEKFLLYGGAIQLAGSVTARKQERETASDWMEMEKKRGISISSTLLQFDYGPWRVNLLDTPGHKDFSEDTYRVLMAVDAVVMVIDAGKGIESQTRKLFEICRHREIPIFTFMNKLDRPILDPLALIDELESVLGIHAYPVNWPLGSGKDFRGVYDRLRDQVHLFKKVPGGAYMAPVSTHGFADPEVQKVVDEQEYRQAADALEILGGAHGGFSPEAVLKGETTPVFFGSAANNFGVQLLLDGFIQYSAGPAERKAGDRAIPVAAKDFSGFIFKIQTNMNPMHRDRIAFLRICSGKFFRDMDVYHTRTGKKIRITGSHTLLGQSRETVDEAYPGDIIGFAVKSDFRIGDTISEDPSVVFNAIPRFAPECFAQIHNPSPAKYKPFRKGLEHLLAEDIVQVFSWIKPFNPNTALLGAVGPLQYEVLQYRLREEYGAESQLEMLPWKILRWAKSGLNDQEFADSLSYGVGLVRDEQGRRALLFLSEWTLNNFQEHNPHVTLFDSPK
ncbi:MAG TPA: peptide chain release factor 3 [Candidatus Omnitrophota bacterium]|nr:peptide chain release factor 3 [Candidatus Omnitrophota bacterium]HPS36325.1 peptide chain release factor 3 [Candidatus Omnitrophota bacterium]